MDTNEATTIEIGTTVQYRKVGTAVVTEIVQRTERSVAVRLAFQTGPAAYRTGKLSSGIFWISEKDAR